MKHKLILACLLAGLPAVVYAMRKGRWGKP